MNRVRQLRLAAGLTQAALAKAAGCTEQAIYYIEHNKRNPSLALAQRIARAVGAPVHVVFPAEPVDDESPEEVLPGA
ncbi:helix-turn-helix transcriptional regulator [Symbiobacterium terraclitae]|uniref:helix-turn-helix transcriptional regulator n=1 Tax=Symbiobacterium terraclitae TaxID=557451 RepID=UPI0035B55313